MVFTVSFQNGSSVKVWWDHILKTWVGFAWIHRDNGRAITTGTIGDPDRRTVFRKMRAEVAIREFPEIATVTRKLVLYKMFHPASKHSLGFPTVSTKRYF